jgi:hypothetical protein
MTNTLTRRLQRFENDHDRTQTITSARIGFALFGHARTDTRRADRNVPRGNPDLHMGEALFGGPTTAPTHRSQCDEKNTSRGRPAGMELPDVAVIVIHPHRRTRMGPHFEVPPGLFPYSYLVMFLAARLFLFPVVLAPNHRIPQSPEQIDLDFYVVAGLEGEGAVGDERGAGADDHPVREGVFAEQDFHNVL